MATNPLRRLVSAVVATWRGRTLLIVLVAVLVWLVANTLDNGKTTPTTASGGSQTMVLSESELEAFAKSLGHPLYWVGPRLGADYQVTSTRDGRVFLYYIPASGQAQDNTSYLSVGTYPLRNAFEATVRTSKKAGFAELDAKPGVAAVYLKSRPTNLYVAFVGLPYQIELFNPTPRTMMDVLRQVSQVPTRGS